MPARSSANAEVASQSHRTHIARKRLSVRADKLFCGRLVIIREPAITMPGGPRPQGVAFLGGQVVIACFPPREHRDKHGKRNKGCDSKCHLCCFPLFLLCGLILGAETASPFEEAVSAFYFVGIQRFGHWPQALFYFSAAFCGVVQPLQR